MLERNVEFKHSEYKRINYTSENQSEDFIYFENATT